MIPFNLYFFAKKIVEKYENENNIVTPKYSIKYPLVENVYEKEKMTTDNHYRDFLLEAKKFAEKILGESRSHNKAYYDGFVDGLYCFFIDEYKFNHRWFNHIQNSITFDNLNMSKREVYIVETALDIVGYLTDDNLYMDKSHREGFVDGITNYLLINSFYNGKI